MQGYVPDNDTTTTEAEGCAPGRGARQGGVSTFLRNTLGAVAVAAVAAVLAALGLADPVLAQGGGQTMDLEAAADDVVAIGVAFILAIIILRFIPDLGKKAYASIGILIIVGSIVYFLAQNPDSFEAIGAFFGELLGIGGGSGGGGN